MKTLNAFQKHLKDCRATARFNGIITLIDEQVLYSQYMTKSLNDFKEYAIKYLKDKDENE